MRAAALILLSAVAASAQVVLEPSDMPTPPGYPPRLGSVTLAEGARTTTMATYDFSIGAFDASAWFGSGTEGKGFHLTAYPEGNPEAEKGLLMLYAGMEHWAPGSGTEALVEITMGPHRHGRRWTSAGQEAEVVIDGFVPQEAGATSGYAAVTGHFAARVCSGDKDPPVVAPNARCRDISGTFATDAQYSP